VTDYDKIILELREENKRLKSINDNLIKSNDSLVKSVNELKQKLACYENPTLRHLKIPYHGENKRQRKDKRITENQTAVAYKVTRVQHRNSSHKERHTTNHLNVLNVAAQTSLK